MLDWIDRVVVALFAAIVLLFLAAFYAWAEEEHDHAAMGATGAFYARWMQPTRRDTEGQRTTSCCSLKDCYATPVRNEGGKWYARSRDGLRWVEIPTHIIEQNQTDENESPDGQSHVCMTESDYVFCFTLGTGI